MGEKVKKERMKWKKKDRNKEERKEVGKERVKQVGTSNQAKKKKVIELVSK